MKMMMNKAAQTYQKRTIGNVTSRKAADESYMLRYIQTHSMPPRILAAELRFFNLLSILKRQKSDKLREHFKPSIRHFKLVKNSANEIKREKIEEN